MPKKPKKVLIFRNFLKNYLDRINSYLNTVRVDKNGSEACPFVIINSIVEVFDCEEEEKCKYRIVLPFSKEYDTSLTVLHVFPRWAGPCFSKCKRQRQCTDTHRHVALYNTGHYSSRRKDANVKWFNSINRHLTIISNITWKIKPDGFAKYIIYFKCAENKHVWWINCMTDNLKKGGLVFRAQKMRDKNVVKKA